MAGSTVMILDPGVAPAGGVPYKAAPCTALELLELLVKAGGLVEVTRLEDVFCIGFSGGELFCGTTLAEAVGEFWRGALERGFFDLEPEGREVG